MFRLIQKTLLQQIKFIFFSGKNSCDWKVVHDEYLFKKCGVVKQM